MKSILALVLLGALLVFADEEKFDSHTIEEIMADQTLRQGYFDCLTDAKACTPDGEELKKALPLALTSDCQGCSDRQKVATEKVIKYVSKNKPEHWKVILEKFDPNGVYVSKHPDLKV